MRSPIRMLWTLLLVALCAWPISIAAELNWEEAPEEVSEMDIVHYDLTVEVQPESHTLVVDAIVQFKIVGEDKGWVDFTLAGEIFSVKDHAGKPLEYQKVATELYVESGSLVEEDGHFEVVISFSRVVFGGGSRVWEQVSPEGTYVRSLTGWYPRGEEGDRATADFRFIVPEGETAVTCGAYQGEVVLADGETAQAWSSDMPITRIGFACGKYVVSHVEGEDFDVQAYLYEEDADRAEEYLELCGEALTLYSDLFGPYPYAKFAVVEIPEGYGGGMGHQSFIMLYEPGFKGEPDEIFWSHEISHNWWGHYVSTDRSFGSWLSEGMATYSSLLFFEHKYAKQVFLEKLHWAAENYLIQAETSEMPLRYARDTIVAYYKGAYFFHMLRYVVGDEAFWGILRKLVAVHGGGGQIDPQIFQEVSEAEAGTDLDWFFTQWLDRTGAPRYELVWESWALPEGGYEVSGTVLQTEGDYRMPVEVRAISGENAFTERVVVKGEETPFSFRVDWRPEEVVLDPDGWVLWYSPYHENLTRILEYQDAGNQLWNQGNYQGAIEQYQAALTLEPEGHTKGSLLHSVGRCLYKLGRYDEAFETLQDALPLLPGTHHTTAWTRATLGYIYLERGEVDKAEEAFEAVIAMQATRNSVAWAQEGLYLARGETPPLAITLASYFMDDDSEGLSQGNRNGYLDPGERIALSVSLKNTGGSSATGLDGILRVADAHIAVVDSVVYFPDLEPEAQADGERQFVFEVSEDYEIGDVVDFDLIVSDAEEHTWRLRFQLGGPVVVEELVVQDGERFWYYEGMGNADGVINPGEFITFTPVVRNLTSKKIEYVSVRGAVSDPYVRHSAGIISSRTIWGRKWGPIAPFDTTRLTDSAGTAGFMVSPETPDGHTFRLDLEITVEWNMVINTTLYLTVRGIGRTLPPYVELMRPLGNCKAGNPLVLRGSHGSSISSLSDWPAYFLIWDVDGIAWAKANFYSVDSILIDSVPLEREGNAIQCTWTPPFESVFYYTITAADNLSNEVKSQPSALFSSMSSFPREHPLLVVRITDIRFGGPLTQETEALLGNGGVQYDVWDQVKLTKLGASDLTPYDPRNPGVLLSPSLQSSAEGRVVLDDFLDCGGKLMLRRISNFMLDFYPEGRTLFSDYLHTFIEEEVTIPRTLQGVEGDPIGDGIALTVRSYQELTVVPPAVPFLTTRGGTPVAVRIEDKGYKAVYFGFSLDAIEEWAVDLNDLELNDEQEAEARAQVLLRALHWLDSSVTEVEAVSHTQSLPKAFAMSQNFPNPFNPATAIRFALPEAGHVQLSVFNLLGQEIRVLAEGFREPGTYRVRWDGKDGHGLEAATGVYLVRLESGSFSATRRMVLIK